MVVAASVSEATKQKQRFLLLDGLLGFLLAIVHFRLNTSVTSNHFINWILNVCIGLNKRYSVDFLNFEISSIARNTSSIQAQAN